MARARQDFGLPTGAGHTTDWDRDAALTTAHILLEIKAVNFRPEEPYTFTSGWKSPVYIDCRRIIYFPRARTKICELAVEEDRPACRLRELSTWSRAARPRAFRSRLGSPTGC